MTVREREKVDKREQIMHAAEWLFANRRLHEITLDEVAGRAGVGKGTIYLHFKDKDDLFFQTATAGFDELCDLLHSAVPTEDDFAGQLLGACRQITAFFDGRRQLFAMMQAEENRLAFFHGELRDRWMARRRNLIAALAGILRKGVAEGAVRRDVPPDTLAAFLLGMLRTRARDLPEMDGAAPSHETVVDLFLRGAGSRHALTLTELKE